MKSRVLFILASLLVAANAFSQASYLTGLVAFWPLQSTNGITTPDIVGGYNLTLSGTSNKVPGITTGGSPASHQNGQSGKAMLFSSTNSETCQYFANFSDALPINKNPAFTVSFWVNANCVSNANNVYVFSESLNANDGLYPFNANPLFSFGMDSGGGTNSTDAFGRFLLRDNVAPGGTTQTPAINYVQASNATSSNVFNGVWHFVVVTMDTNGIYRVYVDGGFDHGSGGALDAQGHPTALQSLPLFTTNGTTISRWQWDLDTTAIGGIGRTTPGASTFNGMMDNVAMWNRALTSNEVSLLFTNGLAASYSVTLQHGLNAIANQLDHGSNTLAEILTGVPNGSTVFTYTPGVGFGSGIVYSTNSGWFDNSIEGGGPTNGPVLAPGQGVFFYNTGAPYVQTFYGTPHVPVLPLTVTCGNYNMWSRQKNGLGTFDNITGVAPQDGDEVLIYQGDGSPGLIAPATLDLQSGDYAVYTFIGGGWTPSPPVVNVGQSAFVRRFCTNCVTVSQGDILTTSATPTHLDFGPLGFDSCLGMGVPTFTRPSAGEIFAIGTTPVHCVALSPSGNMGSCDFLITVAPPPIAPPSSSYTLSIHSGLNLIAYQFNLGGNTLYDILSSSGVPDGCVLTKYDNAVQQWKQSAYNASLGAWVPAMTLKPGEGAFLNSPTSFSLFLQGNLNTPTLPISLANPIQLVSRQTNAFGNFTNITGTLPTAGIHVYKWNGSGYDSYAFDGTSWAPTEPTNEVGEAFWIATGAATPPPIPARPTITAPPTDQSNGLGGSVLLTATVIGDGPFFYQWRLNANVIAGATNSQYLISSLQPSNCGNYDIQIYNAIGITNSFVAKVSISGAPTLAFANSFAAAGALPSTTSGFGVASNTNATSEAGEPSVGGIPGGTPVWVSWTAPTTGIATFSTAGSGFDTLLGVYTGTVISNLTSVAFDDDGAGRLWSTATFNATNGTKYYIQVDGFYGGSGDVLVSWNETPTSSQLPTILASPSSQTVASGGSASFTVSVPSGSSYAYQWLLNGNPLLGATAQTLNVTNVGDADVGVYVAQVVNLVGGLSSTTFPAELQINSQGSGNPINSLARAEDKFYSASDETVRTNDPYDPAIVTGYTATQIFGMYGTTTDPNEPPHCGASCTYTSWHMYLGTNNGVATVDNSGTSFGGVLAVYTGNPVNYSNLVPVACSAGHGIGDEVASFVTTVGTHFWVMMGSTNVADSNGVVHLNYSTITPPLFTLLPISQSVLPNANFSLTTATTGNPPVTYQWMRNGANIPLATTTSLGFNSFQSLSQGNYAIVAANAAGTNIFNFVPVYLDAPLRFSTVQNLNGTYFTQLIGLPNNNYVIQTSGKLHGLPGDWVSNSTVSSATGINNLFDTINTGTNLFYRAYLPAPIQ